MQKREDGIVFSDADLCIGCQTCAVACPFGVPELNPATGKIAKCDGCRDRVDQGLWPSCALKCPTGCLSFGSPQRVVQDLRTREALTIVRSLSVR
jgi:Fe-S-cluster-containing dehydrogenase component